MKNCLTLLIYILMAGHFNAFANEWNTLSQVKLPDGGMVVVEVQQKELEANSQNFGALVNGKPAESNSKVPYSIMRIRLEAKEGRQRILWEDRFPALAPETAPLAGFKFYGIAPAGDRLFALVSRDSDFTLMALSDFADPQKFQLQEFVLFAPGDSYLGKFLTAHLAAKDSETVEVKVGLTPKRTDTWEIRFAGGKFSLIKL